ncbi:hypothetical protein [Streptomyces sp. NPDC003327]
MPTLTTPDGTRLAHRVHGPVAAPPVVLVHGRGEHSGTWSESARDLGPRRPGSTAPAPAP